VRSRVGAAVVVLCLVQFVDVLGVTVVITALPRMLTDVGAAPAAGGPVVTAYAAAFGGLLMFGARLGDRFGHRRVILVSLAVLAAGGALGAAAGSVPLLAVARAVQGAAAAAAVPAALRLLTTVTEPGAQRDRAVAGWSAAGAAAGAGGFLVGGVVTEAASWRWLFGGYLILAAVLALALVRVVPRDSPTGSPRPGLDWRGALALTAAVGALVVGAGVIAEPGRRGVGLGLLVLAAGLAVVVVRVERGARFPLVPGAALRLADLRDGAVASLANTATTGSVFTLVTLDLQDVRGRSPVQAALALLPFSLAVIAASAGAPRLLRRHPSRDVIAGGLAAIAAAPVGLALTGRVDGLVPVWAAVSGAGIGVSSVAATSLGTSVAERWRSVAAGVLNTAAQLGSAVGIAVLLTVTAVTGGIDGPGGRGPLVAWGLAALAAVMAAAAAGHRTRHRSG